MNLVEFNFKFTKVALPIVSDQPANAMDIERLGIGKVVDYFDMTAEELQKAVEKVLDRPVYTENVVKYGKLLMDQISQPLDRAVWHIEYLVRNPELVEYTRPRVHELVWYEYMLLDVCLVILSVLSISLICTFKLLRLSYLWCSSGRMNKIE